MTFNYDIESSRTFSQKEKKMIIDKFNNFISYHTKTIRTPYYEKKSSNFTKKFEELKNIEDGSDLINYTQEIDDEYWYCGECVKSIGLNNPLAHIILNHL